MITFHIRGYDPQDWLLEKLYKDFLTQDPLWHFVYWANGWTHKAYIVGNNIILRVGDIKIQSQIRKYLSTTPEIIFEEYEFPHPRGKYQLGISRLSWEARNLDVALPMLHSISVAFMKWGNGMRYKRFLHHYWHICMNVGGFDHADEVVEMSQQLYSSAHTIKSWYLAGFKQRTELEHKLELAIKLAAYYKNKNGIS